jgi:thiol-disulfide isomerase/thioredoxin
VDWPEKHEKVVALLGKHPDAQVAQSVLGMYMYCFEGYHSLSESASEWAELSAIPGVAASPTGSAIAGFLALMQKPIDLKYTAADGREVDLAKLRGKVVLVDFWATWCHDCKDELPNVLAMYAKYHGLGFEIAGITFESCGVRPGDAPDVAASKIAAAKQKLLDFARDHAMPWPQSFDDKGWKTDLAAPYSVVAIPETLVVGKDGRVVAINAFGPKLDEILKRELGRGGSG